MSAPTMNPPGWYADPTGRHESRYWDSAHWTAQVADHGVTSVEAPPVPVVAEYPPAPVMPAGAGFRAVLIAPWRAALLQFAFAVFGAAIAFELFAEASLTTVVNEHNDTGRMPAESTMRWTSWVYHYTSSVITYGRSPWLMWIIMTAGLIFAVNLLLSKSQALAKSAPMEGRRARRARARRAAEEKKRLHDALRASGAAQTVLRGRGLVVCFVGTAVAALGTAAISLYTITTKEALFHSTSGTPFTGEFSLGIGPTVCLIASALVLVALVCVLPLRRDKRVSVMPDGTLRADDR